MTVSPVGSGVALRRIATLSYGDALPTDARRDGDTPVVGSGGATDTHDQANTASPVIVIGRKGSVGSIQWFNDPVFTIDTAYFVDPVSTTVDLRWLYYVLQTVDIQTSSQDVGVPGLSRDWAYSQVVPVPPPVEEQRRIADFLDDQVAHIDAALDSASSQQQLLQEALIARLNDLTSAPELARERLRSLVRERDVRVGEDADPDLLLAVSIRHGVVPRRDITRDEARADSLTNYKTVHKDDLVLNRMRAFQGGVGRSAAAGICSPDYAVIQPLQRVSGTYLHYVFRAHWFVAEMASRLRGIGSVDQGTVRTPRINVDDLLEIRIPVPAEDRQQKIVDQCAQAEANANERAAALTRLTDLLEERKRSLITAAVTGNLDVTAAKPIGMGRWVPGVTAKADPAATTSLNSGGT